MEKHRLVSWPNGVILLGLTIFLIAILSGEGPGDPQRTMPGPAPAPAYVPLMTYPQDNAPSAAKAALGRHLFYEKALSINGTIACASCHHQDKAFTDGLAFSPGATGEMTRRSAMSLANVGFNSAFTWADNTVVSLEQQALIPLTSEHPVEMGIAGAEEAVLARLAGQSRYREMFAAAFPGNPVVTLDNVTRALAAFQRTLLSYGSAYDKYHAGERNALSAAAERGRTLFFSDRLKCFRCHGGHNFRFTLGHRQSEEDRTVAFHNTGLYNLDGNGSYPVTDQGLIEVTGVQGDMGRFKTPTLRNVALTSPYMHDGSITSLEEVVRHYARGGRQILPGPNAGDGRLNPYKSDLVSGFSISEEESGDVVAFLNSLTDEGFITNAAFSDPAAQASAR